MRLVYSTISPTVAAIQMTLDYANVAYDDVMQKNADDGGSDTEGTVELIVEDDVIKGELAAFLCASRMAHTLPSDPVHCGLVTSAIVDIDDMCIDELEHRLEVSKPNPWLLPQFVESTAADFLCISKFRLLREDNLVDGKEYPLVDAYLDTDPSEATSTYADVDQDAPSRCVVA
jgi:hypothetical protein